MRRRAVLALACLGLLAACKRPTPAPAPADAAPPVAAAPIEADPVLAKIDLSEVRLSHVRDRLGRAAPTESRTTATVQALLEAAADVLVVREMAVLKQVPQPGERPWQAADRFLHGVWTGKACNLAEADLRWVYLRDVGKYKHPPSFTVWDAQLQCCPDPATCKLVEAEACRKAVRPLAEELAAHLAAEFAQLPPLGPAADATLTTLDSSPVRAARLPAFEAAVAARQAREPRLQLRRYTFFQQGHPGFEKANFRPTDPAIEAAVRGARLGDVLGPLDTAWGLDVVLLVAREPARTGMGSDDVQAQVRAQACEELAAVERAEYRQRLVQGAVLHWDRPAIERAFGKDVVALLPADASQRELPHIPSGM